MGSCGISESQVKLGLRKQRKLYFSAQNQLRACGPELTEAFKKPSSVECRPRVPRERQHTNLSSTHNLCYSEVGPREPKKEHTSPVIYRNG